MKNTIAVDIDAYIARFPEETQILLQQIRTTIQKSAPKAEEVISYGMPAFKLHTVLVYFAGYKYHIGFYPTSSGIRIFQDEIAAYKNSKGAVQFPLDKKLPLSLIAKIVRFRMKEEIEKAKGNVSKEEDFSLLATPAKRALLGKNIKTLKQLAKYHETDIETLHRIENNALANLRQALTTKALKFLKKKSPMKNKISDQEQVTAHIQRLDPSIADTVETIRQSIMGTHKLIAERIKWNNPSFYYSGEMKTSDPKEYKREIAVFNLFKGRIMLVMPSGAKTNDTSGLLEGDYKDGRRTITFNHKHDFLLKEKALQKVIKEWIKRVDQD